MSGTYIIKNKKYDHFAMVPKSITDNDNLTAKEKEICMLILSNAPTFKIIKIAIYHRSSIGSKTGEPNRTFNTAWANLIKLGYLYKTGSTLDTIWYFFVDPKH